MKKLKILPNTHLSTHTLLWGSNEFKALSHFVMKFYFEIIYTLFILYFTSTMFSSNLSFLLNHLSYGFQKKNHLSYEK